MKKLFALLLALSMVFALCACGSSDAKKETLTFTTGGEAGTYYAFGSVLAQYVSSNSDLNVVAVFNGHQAAAKIMTEAGHGGTITTTSSMVAKYGQPSGVGYPTSKFAVNGMVQSLSRELAPMGIRVNAVAPGVTKTDMVANLPEEVIKPIIATIPLGRMGEPEDVANAFVYLASDMSSYVTGAVLPVDGAARS